MPRREAGREPGAPVGTGPPPAPRSPDRGFVTAESAVVLPVLTVFALALVWALLAAAAQIQCVDAARAGARAAARQDPDAVVVDRARRAAPEGARVTVRRADGLVRVEVVAPPPGPDAVPLRLRHTAVAAAEEDAEALP
ncbi:TadE family type IV pilus minor pilin [Streptomyces sp. NPDC049906]|uniref:TadE family type IV pilus minor pilin n=1 Tax=Streptomyces sp. NPDC049906 TaxID=3155656 RepID=UPI00344327BD